MKLIRTSGLAAMGRVSLFAAIGALLGYIQMLLGTHLDQMLELQPDPIPDLILDAIKTLCAYVLIQCLTIIAALASWKFAFGDTYWKAPLLYFLVLVSAALMLAFIPDVIVNDLNDPPVGGARLRGFIENRSAWSALIAGVTIIISEALDVFATFAFVIRAMIVRSGKWAGLVFLLVGAIAGLCFTLSVNSNAVSLLQSPFLLGLSALAFRVLPAKSTVPTIQTHIVEAR